MDPEQLDEFVMGYLKKKGFNGAAKQLQEALHNNNNNNGTGSSSSFNSTDYHNDPELTKLIRSFSQYISLSPFDYVSIRISFFWEIRVFNCFVDAICFFADQRMIPRGTVMVTAILGRGLITRWIFIKSVSFLPLSVLISLIL